jgi:ABC-type uncharacterized transport system substrate-binding protein
MDHENIPVVFLGFADGFGCQTVQDFEKVSNLQGDLKRVVGPMGPH